MSKSYYLQEGAAVVTFAASLSNDFDQGQVRKLTPPGGSEAVEIMSWGKDNDLPQQRELLVSSNNIVPALIERKRNILIGSGIVAYKKRFETGPNGKGKIITEEVQMDSAVEDWLNGEGWSNGSDFYTYLSQAAGEFAKHSLIIPEFIRRKDGKSISSVEVKECRYMRAGKKNDAGKIARWYWSGHWGRTSTQNNKLEKRKTVGIDVYNGEDKPQLKFIKPAGDYLLNDGYYPIPTYWGGWEWIELANQIPQFHRANLTNGYNIRWHVKIPADYFLDYEQYQEAATATDKKKVLDSAREKEEAFMNDINEFLAGLANTGRTVFTKFELDKALGKELPGISITPLNYDMKDEALLQLFERSNVANTSAQGIHPSLAGIETQGKLSSGTEIRNAFLMWLIINTPQPRKWMLDPLNLVKKANGWPTDIYYGIRDYELTALSDDKSGMAEKDPNPA